MKNLLVSCALLCLCSDVLTESVNAMNPAVQNYRAISQQQREELFKAIKEDRSADVESMINQWNVDPNLKDERDATLLMIAFEHLSTDTAYFLRGIGALTIDEEYEMQLNRDR